MPVMATSALPAALLRATVGVHLLTTAWLLVNGFAHEVHVLIKARAGTLRGGPTSLEPLLTVGAGLLLAGAAYAWSSGALLRAPAPSLGPTAVSAVVLAGVLIAVASRYGFTFLGGSIALGVVDAALLAACALQGR